MFKKFVSTFLPLIIVLNVCFTSVFAATPTTSIKICGNTISTNQHEVYFRFENDGSNNVIKKDSSSSSNWNVCFKSEGSGASATRKLIFKDLILTYKNSGSFIRIDDYDYNNNFVIEFQGTSILTSKNTSDTAKVGFIDIFGSADIKGTDGSSLILKGSNKGYTSGISVAATSTAYTYTLNFTGANITCDFPNPGFFTTADKVNVSNCVFDFSCKRSYMYPMINATNSISIKSNSDVEILLGSEEENYWTGSSSNCLNDIGICSNNIEIVDSATAVYIYDNGVNNYGITMPVNQYNVSSSASRIAIDNSRVITVLNGEGTNQVNIGASEINISDSDCLVIMRGNFVNGIGVAAWGWNSFTNHSTDSKRGLSNISNSTLDVTVVSTDPSVCHGISLQGATTLDNSEFVTNVILSAGKAAGIYFGSNVNAISANKYDLNISDNSETTTNSAIYFDNCTNGSILSLGEVGTLKIFSNDIGISSDKSATLVLGGHFDVDIKVDNSITSSNLSYKFADTFVGTSNFSDSGVGENLTTDVHYFNRCTASKCSYEGCTYVRMVGDKHAFSDSNVCTKCSYISEVNIDIDVPVATKALDTTATISVYGIGNIQNVCVVNSVAWTCSGKVATGNAAYDSIYKVTIDISPIGKYWFDSDTIFNIDKNKVKLNDDLLIEYIFKPTDKNANSLDPNTPNASTTPPSGETSLPPTSAPTNAPTQTPDVSADPTPTEEPKSDVGDFVQRCYKIALGREAESEGYKYWVDNLNQGRVCGAQVGFGFIFSQEYMNKNRSNEDFVKDLYSMYFDREPDEFGFEYWVERLENGESREEIFAGFANSLEFYMLCVDYNVVAGYYVVGVPNAQQGGVNCFVARLYIICFDRLPDMGGHAGWVLKLINGEVTGSTAAYGFVFSPEFTNLKLDNTNFVKYMYRAFFGREADDGGLNYWVSQMEAGTSTQTDVFNGFTGSAEFANLCAEYGINP